MGSRWDTSWLPADTYGHHYARGMEEGVPTYQDLRRYIGTVGVGNTYWVEITGEQIPDCHTV